MRISKRLQAHGQSAVGARPWTRALGTALIPFQLLLLVLVAGGLVGLRVGGEASAPPHGESSDRALADVARAATRSVGLVLIVVTDENGVETEDACATAWVVGDGRLGTAAHVAAIRDELGPDERLIVRFPGPDAVTVRIVGDERHPRYAAPDLVPSGPGAPSLANGWVPAADVALLRVASEDAKLLPPPLPLAPDDVLHGLGVLDRLVLVGHPLEELVAGGSDARSPTPGAFVGTISRITDHRFRPASPDAMRLLHVDVPATGGASGSPVLNARGQVVGILSAANFAHIGGVRIPLAVGLNFVQRIDWLRELLDERSATR